MKVAALESSTLQVATCLGVVDPKRVWKLMSLNEALSVSLSQVKPFKSSTVRTEVLASYDRILMEDVRADRDIPAFPRAAVDGYVVNSRTSQDATPVHPIKLRIVGEIVTGAEANIQRIGVADTAYITCGSQLPDGSDAVLRHEEVKVVNGFALIARALSSGENVDQRGQDVKKADTVLKAGRILRAQDIALLLSLGRKAVKVLRKPRIAILPVGDELVDFTSHNGHGVIENNSSIFSRLFEEFYARPLKFKPVGDDVNLVSRRLEEAMKNSDMTVTTGGSSVGTKDLVPEAVRLLNGSEFVFHGVAVFPGKPVGFAMVGTKPVLMLPGRIMAALAGYYLFGIPILSKLTGIDLVSWIPKIRATVKVPISAKNAYSRFEILKLKKTGSAYEAELLPKGVGLLSNFVQANGFVVLRPGERLEAGDKVEVRLFTPAELKLIHSLG